MLNHQALPLAVVVVVGSLLAAWHSSLVHESVHNLNTAPKWLKMLLVLPPIGVWYPYHFYARSHSIHHRDDNLTDPAKDPESFYFAKPKWESLHPAIKTLMVFNQTFLGRLVVGPFISVYYLVNQHRMKVLAGDKRTIRGLISHGVLLAGFFWFVVSVAGMSAWFYIFCIALPGLAVGLIRSFCEHGAALDPAHRTAIVESGLFFNILFLYNNLHVVHHLDPSMRWYDIPKFYREHREELLEGNGGLYFPSYFDVIRRTLIKPAYIPVHPGT
jgi:fatty acid desaturase